MIDPDLERTLRLLKLHDEPRARQRVVDAHGSVPGAWEALGRHLEHGLGMRSDRVSAREAYKSALQGDPDVAASAAFRMAMLLEGFPELCEEYGDGRRTFGTSPDQYWKQGAKLAIAAADARVRFWVPNQRSLELGAKLGPLIARRKLDAGFGSPDAMYELSVVLGEGFGVPRHLAAAATWLHRAAAAGHLAAACRLKPAGWHDVVRAALAPGVAPMDAPALAQGPGPLDAPSLGGGPASPFQLLRASLPPTLPARWAGAVPPPGPDDPALADAGDVEAQLRLGAAAEAPEEGAFWLALAAAAGHPSAFPPRDALPPAPDAEDRAAAWWARQRL